MSEANEPIRDASIVIPQLEPDPPAALVDRPLTSPPQVVANPPAPVASILPMSDTTPPSATPPPSTSWNHAAGYGSESRAGQPQWNQFGNPAETAAGTAAPFTAAPLLTPQPAPPPATAVPWVPPQNFAQNDVVATGVSDTFNSRGHTALGLGIVGVILTTIMVLGIGAILLVNVGVGLAAIGAGIKGHNAANRALATNPRSARAGLIMGAITVLAVPCYLVYTAYEVARVISEA